MKTNRMLHEQLELFRSFSQPARLFLLALTLDGILFSGWNLFFNFFILARGFDRDFLGLINAVPSLALLLFGLPVGHLSDRLGRKRAMLVGFILCTLFLTVEVSTTNPTLILAAAFLGGPASGLYFMSQAPFMMKVSNEKNRAMLFSASFGLVTLAGALGNVLAGHLPALFGGWLNVPDTHVAAYQAVMLFSLVSGLLVLVPLFLIKEPRAAEPQPETAGLKSFSFWAILSRPLTLKLALPNLVMGIGAAILIPYLNLYFSEHFGVSDQNLGVLFSLSALITGVGTIIGPRLSANMGSKVRASVITQLGGLISLILMGFTPFLWLSAISFLARGVLMNMASPLLDAFAMEQVQEREQGMVNSARTLSWQVGWSFAPYLSGLVQQKYGFTPLFVCTGILYALSITLNWAFFRTSEKALQLENAYEAVRNPGIPVIGDQVPVISD